MARSKIKFVQFRRKRKGKTDYRLRLKLLLSGKPRIVVRKSLNNILLQVVEYAPSGDRVITSVHSSELRKLGWNLSCSNTPAAYLTGYLLGKKAVGKKVKDCILDAGLYTSVKGSRIYAALRGVAEAGVAVPFSKEVVPSDDRIKGKHIAEFAKKAKSINQNQFSRASPESIEKLFADVKQKIEGRKNG